VAFGSSGVAGWPPAVAATATSAPNARRMLLERLM
jgi:hypothetical protein